MKRNQWISWLIFTLFFGGIGLPLAFFNSQTMLVGFLIYLPLTAGIVWLGIFRRKLWFALWFFLFLAWLVYIGPLVALLLPNYSNYGY